MKFAVLMRALLRRELGQHPLRRTAVWVLFGGIAAIADVRFTFDRTPGLFGRLITDLPTVLGYVVAIAAALQVIARLAEDRLRGWLLGWCGNGGRREHYVGALYGVVMIGMISLFATTVISYAVAHVVLGAGMDPGRLAMTSARAIATICTIGAYGLLLGTIMPRVLPAVLAAVALYIVPLIIVAILVVTKDLPAAPGWARYAFMHMPPFNVDATVSGFLRQITYVAGMMGAAVLVGLGTAGRTA